MAGIALVHFGADLVKDGGVISVPDFAWLLLLFIPVIYAGMTFGLVGSLDTALVGLATVAPVTLLQSHSSTELWGECSILAVMVLAAVVVGDRFETQQAFTRVRRSAEIFEAIRDSEERFRLAFDAAPIGMTFTSREGQFLRVNAAFCEMVGRSAAEVIHLGVFGLTDSADLDSSREALEISANVDHFTKHYRHADGHLVIVQVTSSLLHDPSGEFDYFISHFQDVTDERALAAQLSDQALHDSLTGLANRTLLQDRLATAHDRGVRHGGHCALFLLDLDDFKSVNDAFGHEIGDQLLITLARRLERVTRAPDTLCRFGGDEFIYLAEGIADEIDTERIIERLLEVFTEPFLVAGIKIEQSTSIGVAVSDATSDEGYMKLVQNADTAVYEAKRQGRGRYVMFTPAMSEQVSERFALAQDLGHALARHELSMHYQPIVDLGTGGVVGYEALMRWQHAERGSIPPEMFIPLAEQSRLIVKLGSFALVHATTVAGSWEDATPDSVPPYVAVNISARQFYDIDLFSSVEEALASSMLTSGRLVLEITEGVALFDIDAAISVIKRLKKLNVVVALDDFGTGFSSLSYLVRLSPDIIKIDRSFISPATMDTSATRLLEAIVRLCQGLDVVALAEGIETREQLTLLSELGCQFGQGYLFSPAVPASGLSEMHDLVRRNWVGRA